MTPAARSGNLIAGDGTENGFSLGTKNRHQTKNNRLTGKAPYKVSGTEWQFEDALA